MREFRDLGQRVRTHICYAHVFGDALTEDQLVERCAPHDREGVRRELEMLEVAGRVERVGGHWFLQGASVDGIAESKTEGESTADRIIRDHGSLLALLKRLRVVRLLAISGSVAWGNHGRTSGKRPDLDLFIITAPDSVHCVRLLVRAWEIAERWLQRAGARAPRPKICANYMTDAAFLEVTNASFYTASDALHVIVLKGSDEYARFISANAWMGRYYPIAVCESVPPVPRGGGLLRGSNVLCYGVLAASSWVKGFLKGWSQNGVPFKFEYSLRFRADTNVSLRRSAPAGGGYQPQVARRFRQIYSAHFGQDPGLQAFLFPGTTENGVHTVDGHAESTIPAALGYHE